MSEYQDLTAVQELGTENWVFVGVGSNNEEWTIYETNNGELFAINTENEYGITFDVYEENGEFLVYE